MQCSDIDKLIPTYLDSELAESELAAFEHHVAECESCATDLRHEREFLQKLRGAFKTPPKAPELLRARLASKLDLEDQANAKKIRKQQLGWLLPGAATVAAAAALFIFAFNIARPSHQAPQTSNSERPIKDPKVIAGINPKNTSSDMARSAQKFVGMPVQPPQFRNASLRRWQPMHTRNHNSALFIYELTQGKQTHQVEVQVLDARNLDLQGTTSRVVEGTQVWVASAFGVNAVSLRDSRGIGYVYVSRLDIEALAQIAVRSQH